jgi:twitching motility protein PilT
MAIFGSETKDLLRKLSDKGFGSTEERDALLAKLAATEGLRAREIIWMLFRPDRAIRDAGAKLLQKLRDPETLDLFLAETKNKPESVIRAASPILFQLGVPGLEARLLQLLGAPDKDIQEAARKLALEAPVTKTLEPALWQIVSSSPKLEERSAALTRLGTSDIDEKAIPRWQKLAREGDKGVKEKALEILATRAPAMSVDILVEQLASAGYGTQQMIVEALTRAAQSGGASFAKGLLPLLASGEAGTRSAVLKILLGMPDRRTIVKQYIMFAKTLAGWARDRALDSMKAFENDLIEPTIELLGDPDEEVRAAAMVIASSFDDPRIIPPTIALLKDPDWWIRITAVEKLGRMKDPRSVDAIVAVLDDPDVRWSAVEALGRIADQRALPILGKLLADPQPDVRIEVLQALKNFKHPQVLDAVQKVAANDPSRAVRGRALDVAQEIAARDPKGGDGNISLAASALAAKAGQGEPKLHSLLVATRNQGASDLHLSVGQAPIVRIASELMRASAAPFTAEQTEEMLREILTDVQWERLATDQQLDFCYFLPQGGRYRANIFIDQRGMNAVFRVIAEKPPTITELGLPAQIAEIADYHQGLVLICGPSGSGKSTTLAALVNLFNETRHDHVLTMEDPVEFVHPFKNCLINQREVGTHTGSFARALRAALREDPDVIVIGEMRDNETVSLALTAAETGHIVLGTLNSTSAPKAIDRIISSFPSEEQAQIRTALSESLKYVIAQRLLPAKEARRQVACFEILKATSSVANLIRDEKTYQIYSAMQIGRSLGMQTSDDALKDLVKRQAITAETAYLHAMKKEEFEGLVSPEFLRSQSFV